jgi:hypothetical protein
MYSHTTFNKAVQLYLGNPKKILLLETMEFIMKVRATIYKGVCGKLKIITDGSPPSMDYVFTPTPPSYSFMGISFEIYSIALIKKVCQCLV